VDRNKAWTSINHSIFFGTRSTKLLDRIQDRILEHADCDIYIKNKPEKLYMMVQCNI
jgi:hypothetical protein